MRDIGKGSRAALRPRGAATGDRRRRGTSKVEPRRASRDDGIAFGRKRPLSTAVGEGRDAPSSEHSDVGDGSRKSEHVPAEARRFGGRCEDWRYNPKRWAAPQRSG